MDTINFRGGQIIKKGSSAGFHRKILLAILEQFSAWGNAMRLIMVKMEKKRIGRMKIVQIAMIAGIVGMQLICMESLRVAQSSL